MSRTPETCRYRCPRQPGVQGDMSPACDIYSLGCLMWEMLHAQPLWVGLSQDAILARVAESQEGPPFARHIPAPVQVSWSIGSLPRSPAQHSPLARSANASRVSVHHELHLRSCRRAQLHAGLHPSPHCSPAPSVALGAPTAYTCWTHVTEAASLPT